MSDNHDETDSKDWTSLEDIPEQSRRTPVPSQNKKKSSKTPHNSIAEVPTNEAHIKQLEVIETRLHVVEETMHRMSVSMTSTRDPAYPTNLSV